jgi:peptidoglycan/LPS O-acetylase OafA/YrhL
VSIAAAQTSPAVLVEEGKCNPRSRSFNIASLDGIRGVAFLLVFFSHAGLRNIVPGGFGVTVFFVLSGYLITTLLRLEYEESGTIDLKAFYLRRAFRILPLFYVVLLAAILLRCMGQLGGTLHLRAVVSQICQWSNFYLISHGPTAVIGGTIVLWSLAVEEHFYLVFPPLYRIICKKLSKPEQVRLLWVGCAVCLLWRCVLIFAMHRTSVRTELGTDTRFDCLLFGAIMAVAANPALDTSRWFSASRLRMLVPVSLACLLFTFVNRNEDFRFTLRFTLQAVALLPLFAYAILARDSLAFRILNSTGMTRIGVLSYGLYLVHAIVLEWFSIHLHAGEVVVAILAFATALLIAKILQLAIERPFQALRKKYSRVNPQQLLGARYEAR